MKRLCVLCYHRILNIYDDYNMINVSPQNFEEQMKYIKDHYEIASLDEESFRIKSDKQNGVWIAVSFDDGYADFMGDALSIIKKYQIPTTLFLSTDKIGSNDENWMDEIIRLIFKTGQHRRDFFLKDEEISGYWVIDNYEQRVQFYYAFNRICRNVNKYKRDKYIATLRDWAQEYPRIRSDRRLLNEPELCALKECDLISFGAHTVSHPSLAALSIDEQYKEIEGSKKKIERILGDSIDMFAYPFGSNIDYSDDTISVLKDCGFSTAYTTDCRCYSIDADPYRIPRCVVPNFRGTDFERWIMDITNNQAYGGNDSQIVVCDNRESWITYVGHICNDSMLRVGNIKAVIWGMGKSGKEIYDYMLSLSRIDIIVYWGDKKVTDLETTYKGIKVIDYEKLAEYQRQNKDVVILTKGIYAWEVSRELKMYDIHNIHIYI